MIYDWAREQAKINPGKIAVTLDGDHLSYGKLESLSNRLAGMLLVAGLKPGERVALMMDKTPDYIVAMHGISKAGGVYVPVNTGCSKVRMVKALKAVRPKFIIVDKKSNSAYLTVTDHSKKIKNVSWMWWSKDICIPRGQNRYCFSLEDIEQHPDYPYQKIRNEDAPACLIFKTDAADQHGIVISHKNISAFINWTISYFDIEPHDRISGYSPFYTDLSTFDIYSTLAAGAHLYIVPPEQNLMPDKLSSFILENDITQWCSSLSDLDFITHFRSIPDGGYSGLKRLILGGEKLEAEALQYWMKQNPHAKFTSLFGAPEATIASGYYTFKNIPKKNDVLPIGSPCFGEDLLVLDEEMNPVDDGVIGDLYISGKGLSAGYWKNKQKTKNSFYWYINIKGEKIRVFKTGELASQGSDGLFYYHGKAEYQISSNGHRIKVGDIESALSKIKKLREYAIVPVENGAQKETAIGCAYVTAGKENGKMPPILAKNLQKSIPKYMVPQYWKCFDKLPRKLNGKVDRKQLREAFKS